MSFIFQRDAAAQADLGAAISAVYLPFYDELALEGFPFSDADAAALWNIRQRQNLVTGNVDPRLVGRPFTSLAESAVVAAAFDIERKRGLSGRKATAAVAERLGVGVTAGRDARGKLEARLSALYPSAAKAWIAAKAQAYVNEARAVLDAHRGV